MKAQSQPLRADVIRGARRSKLRHLAGKMGIGGFHAFEFQPFGQEGCVRDRGWNNHRRRIAGSATQDWDWPTPMFLTLVDL